MKVLFTYDYGEDKNQRVRDLGYEVIVVNEKEVRNTKEINDVDALVCYNPFDTLDISMMSNLKLIQLSSIGVDQVPKDKLMLTDAVLCNNRGGYSIPIGEWIVHKTLEIYKKSREIYRNQEDRKWKIYTDILELSNKNIFVVGTGSIGKEAAKRFKGFDVNLIGFNTTGKDVEYFDRCYPLSNIVDKLRDCDVLVLSIPYTERTHHLIDPIILGKLKDEAVIINVSRGSIIDETALVQELRNKRFMGVALDVFEKEPLDESSELWGFNNVYISSHNSWISEYRNERRFINLYENLKKFSEGNDLINVIDIDKGY